MADDYKDLHSNPKYIDIMNAINSQLQTVPNEWHNPKEDELKQFHQSAFYHNWRGRFEQLGLYGVLAIPNTTFEQWLWWFHEWAEAFIDDYNAFKRMVYNALKLIQEYLDALNKRLDDDEKKIAENTKRIEKLEKVTQQLKDDINKINNQIQQMGDEINNLKNLVNDLAKGNEALTKILQHLKDQGAWNQTGGSITEGDFAQGQSVASGNINLYTIAKNGGYYIKTHVGADRDGDITQGL